MPMNTRSSRWRNAVALSWTTAGRPVDVNLKEIQNIWTFSAGHRTVEFDWATGTAEMPR